MERNLRSIPVEATNMAQVILCVVMLVALGMILNPEPAIAVWNGSIDGIVSVIDLLLVRACGEKRPIN
jgi:hypothetical protein